MSKELGGEMQFKELGKVYRSNTTQFWLWLTAMLGGILLSCLASLTILVFHKSTCGMLPDWRSILLSGVVALSISGLSYLRAREVFPNTAISSKLIYSWPALLMFNYGILTTVGTKEPSICSALMYVISVIVCIMSIIWSVVIWLHEQGIRDERHEKVVKPKKTPGLDEAVLDLPQYDARGE